MSISERVTLDQDRYGFFVVAEPCDAVPAEADAGLALLAELKAKWRTVGYEFRLFGRSIDECWNDDMRAGYRQRVAEEDAQPIPAPSDEYECWYDEDGYAVVYNAYGDIVEGI